LADITGLFVKAFALRVGQRRFGRLCATHLCRCLPAGNLVVRASQVTTQNSWR